MTVKINVARLADRFVSLCETDSPSKKEGRLAACLKEIMAGLGADLVIEDDSASRTGADCGNLLVRFNGTLDRQPIFFNCHMDTVEPGIGVKVRRLGDTFTSAGDTILGADDKSGIAIIIEAMQILQEKKIPYGPVECIFTTCEEAGLLGAKSLNFPDMQAEIGYALDTTGSDRVVIGAPAANKLIIEIAGIAAHAGLEPEKGINAIQLGAQAIAGLQLGRLDQESTANIGLISGGTARNIVPDKVIIQGEVRSHAENRLAAYTEDIRKIFEQTVQEWTDPKRKGVNPRLTFSVQKDYPVMLLRDTDPVLERIARAAAALNRKLDYVVAGGGSDANIFCNQGKPCAIVGTGMTNAHSTEESIDLADMVRTADLVLSILT